MAESSDRCRACTTASLTFEAMVEMEMESIQKSMIVRMILM
jgi:hypothetical protein